MLDISWASAKKSMKMVTLCGPKVMAECVSGGGVGLGRGRGDAEHEVCLLNDKTRTYLTRAWMPTGRRRTADSVESGIENLMHKVTRSNENAQIGEIWPIWRLSVLFLLRDF
jgi:hypothetical protein